MKAVVMKIVTLFQQALKQLRCQNFNEKEKVLADIEASLVALSTCQIKKHFIVGLVNKKEKIDNKELLTTLDDVGYFSSEAYRTTLNEKKLQALRERSQSYFQTVDFALFLEHVNLENLDYKAKRRDDYWRRIVKMEASLGVVTVHLINAAELQEKNIEHDLNTSANGQWVLESDLRDAIRSKKESSALKDIPFVWIGIVLKSDFNEKNLKQLCQHYFEKNFVRVESENCVSFMGFNEKLSDINMRYFYKKRL